MKYLVRHRISNIVKYIVEKREWMNNDYRMVSRGIWIIIVEEMR